MKEKDLQGYIIKALTRTAADGQRPVYITKVMQASPNGTPDLLICADGRFYALEVKSPANPYARPTALQQLAIDRINAAGGVALVIYSREQADRVIGMILGENDLTKNNDDLTKNNRAL